MKSQLFINAMIFDGDTGSLYPGEVLVADHKIRHVAKGCNQLKRDADAVLIDSNHATLMPGLIDGHTHLSYPFAIDRSPPGITWWDAYSGRVPVEQLMLLSAHNADVLLQAGFTSAYSGGGATRSMESALRAEIEGGWIRGPRFRPAGSEGVPYVPRATTERDVCEFVETSAEAGVDIVKFFLSGPAAGGPEDNGLMYSDELMLTAAHRAQTCGVWLSAHARSAEAIKQALKCGFRVLYHCDDLDAEALDMMEERRNEVFVGPSIGIPVAYLKTERLKGKAACLEADPGHPAWDLKKELESQARNCAAMLERGIRLLAGGDYGFDVTPHGHNARDLGYFVKHMGMSPLAALQAATKVGGELMDLPVGLVKEGCYADLLLIDGDPLKDVELLADSERVLMIMKGGEIIKRRESVKAHGC